MIETEQKPKTIFKEIDWETFAETFKPIQNHLDDNASFDLCMYETYGPQHDYVLSFARSDDPVQRAKVWTVLDVDGRTIHSSGYHWVNRQGYFITEVPCPENEEIDVLEDHEPDEDTSELTLRFRVQFQRFGTEVADLKAAMENVAKHAIDRGLVTDTNEATIKNYSIDVDVPPQSFDKNQQLVLESYDCGAFAHISPAQIKNCGDSLLIYLLVELSSQEDSLSLTEAVRRLDFTIEQVKQVRERIEERRSFYEKLAEGDEVTWVDPDFGVSSGVYTVHRIDGVPEDRGHETMAFIKNKAGSEAEVLLQELY